PRTIVTAGAAIVIKGALRTLATRAIGRTVRKATPGRAVTETAAGGTIATIARRTSLKAALRTITEAATGRTIATIAGRPTFEAACRTVTIGTRATLRAVAEGFALAKGFVTIWLLVAIRLLVTVGLLVTERLLIAVGLLVAKGFLIAVRLLVAKGLPVRRGGVARRTGRGLAVGADGLVVTVTARLARTLGFVFLGRTAVFLEVDAT